MTGKTRVMFLTLSLSLTHPAVGNPNPTLILISSIVTFVLTHLTSPSIDNFDVDVDFV